MRFTSRRIVPQTTLFVLLAACLLAPCICAQAPTPAATPTPANVSAANPNANPGCCGPVTLAGQQLLHTLDRMDVEHLWLAGRRVGWRTGLPRGPMHHSAKPDTHCSAFAAAAGERLGVYMLRPPEHSQNFLASAQGRWFLSSEARDRGWIRDATSREAQQLANQGELVVLDFINPERGKHGHIALVRPALKSVAQLAADGPETMQAGLTNFADGNARRSFHSHPGAWPDHVTMWAHPTTWQKQESE